MVWHIPLTQGYVALVDDADYAMVGAHKWRVELTRTGKVHRVVRTTQPDGWRGRKVSVSLHRVLMDAPSGIEVDHVDRDPLNNQRSNLRFATRQQNNQNTGIRSDNTSGFKGVHFDTNQGLWVARIRGGDGRMFLGRFSDPFDAAQAYDAAARQVFGEFASLNFSESRPA